MRTNWSVSVFCIGAFLLVAAFCVVVRPASAADEKCADLSVGKCSVTLDTGITMSYVDTGPASGTPVILIHGFTDSLHTWAFVTPPMHKAEPQMRFIAIDLRGHGSSSMPPATQCAAQPETCFRLSDHAMDVIAFMRVMNIGRAHLVGHSLGSFVVQEIALGHPEMVDRAIMIGTSTKVAGNPTIHDFLLRDTIEGSWKPALEAKGKSYPDDVYNLTILDADSNAKNWLATTWGSDPVEKPDWLAGYLSEAARVRLGTWIGGSRAVLAVDNTDRLTTLKVPTLVIWGIQDGIFYESPDQKAIQRVLAEAAGSNNTTNFWKQYGTMPLPQSGIQETDIGHTVQEDAPEAVAADIVAFIKTGAPTRDMARSDQPPGDNRILVEPDKAIMMRFGS